MKKHLSILTLAMVSLLVASCNGNGETLHPPQFLLLQIQALQAHQAQVLKRLMLPFQVLHLLDMVAP